MRRPVLLIAALTTATLALATIAAPALACPGSPDPCPYRAVQQFGTTNGVLQFPEAVAAAPDGSVLVPNSFDYHVSRFSNAGAFVASNGAPTLSAPPPDGTSNGSLGIAVDPATGNYYVLDNDNNRVEEYSPTGAFLHRMGNADGSAGNGIGEFSLKGTVGLTGGITLANGFVWIADGGNARIQRVGLSLTSPVVLNGSSFVGHPTGIQVAGGVLWVTDHESSANTNRIVRYALSGTTLSSPVTATVPFADPLVYDAAANAIYTAALGIERLNATTLNGLTTVIPTGRGPGQTNEPLGLTQLGGGDLVVAQGDDLLKRFTTAGAEVWKAGVNQHATGVVLTAEGLSVAANGDLLVATQGTQQITRFNTAGAFVSRFGSASADPAGSWFPTSVAPAPDGTLWVGDSTGRVIHFGADGSYLGDAAGDLGQAIVDVDGHGQVDELGLASQVVRRFDAAGTLLGSFGSSGTGPGQMSNAQSLVAGADGTIAIADAGNHRVDLFKADGTFLRSFGSAGTGPGQFQFVRGVALDGQGNLFALDSGLNRVQEFTLDGTLRAMWGAAGGGDGQFYGPTSIAADGPGDAYVGDPFQHRVQEFVLAPPPAVPVTAPAPAPPPPTIPRAAKLKLTTSGAIQLSALLRHGVDVRLTSDQAGRASFTLAVSAPAARKIGLRLATGRAAAKPKLSTKPVSISTGAAAYIAPRTRTITLKLSLKAKVKLKHLHLARRQTLKLALAISFKTTANKVTSASKTIKLER